jgi:hypothetical protein
MLLIFFGTKNIVLHLSIYKIISQAYLNLDEYLASL